MNSNEEQLIKENKELKARVKLYERLALAGLNLEMFGHDMIGDIHSVKSSIYYLENESEDKKDRKERLQTLRDRFDQLVYRLEVFNPWIGRATEKGPDYTVYISGDNIKEYLLKLQFYRKDFLESTIFTDEFLRFSLRAKPWLVYSTLLNLFRNAYYWSSKTKEEKPVIQFHANNNSRKIIVSDNGPGVSNEDIPKLFDPYFTKRENGKGLGLCICRDNMSRAGFELYYATDPAEKLLSGANFVIKLPKHI